MLLVCYESCRLTQTIHISPYIPGVSFVVLLASSYDVTYDNTATTKSGSVVVPVVTAEPYTRIFIPFAPRLLTRSVLQMASQYIYYLMLSFRCQDAF